MFSVMIKIESIPKKIIAFRIVLNKRNSLEVVADHAFMATNSIGLMINNRA